MAREPISLSLRFRVLTRDRFTCVYCGAHPPDVELVLDHAQAVADGGLSMEANLVTACEDCNAGKAGRTVIPPRREKGVVELTRDEARQAVFDYYTDMFSGQFGGDLVDVNTFLDDMDADDDDLDVFVAARLR